MQACWQGNVASYLRLKLFGMLQMHRQMRRCDNATFEVYRTYSELCSHVATCHSELGYVAKQQLNVSDILCIHP